MIDLAEFPTQEKSTLSGRLGRIFPVAKFFVRSRELIKRISRLLDELNRSSLSDIARQKSFEREDFQSINARILNKFRGRNKK